MRPHAKTNHAVLNDTSVCEDMVHVNLCHSVGWVTSSSVPPLAALCSFCICIHTKTMASTSSVSQVSAWTWSRDNLPRSSFLLHQMRVSVSPSWISFTFSHLRCTFIIQIRMLSRKTDGAKRWWVMLLPLLSMRITLSDEEGTNCVWGSVYERMEFLLLQVRNGIFLWLNRL